MIVHMNNKVDSKIWMLTFKFLMDKGRKIKLKIPLRNMFSDLYKFAYFLLSWVVPKILKRKTPLIEFVSNISMAAILF